MTWVDACSHRKQSLSSDILILLVAAGGVTENMRVNTEYLVSKIHHFLM